MALALVLFIIIFPIVLCIIIIVIICYCCRKKQNTANIQTPESNPLYPVDQNELPPY